MCKSTHSDLNTDRITRWERWPILIFVMSLLCVEDIMHNLIHYNQLAEWKQFEDNLDKCNDELDLINDYFNCLIECEEDQSTCKRVCRSMLND